MKTVPFNYMHENGKAFCPKCASEISSEQNLDRTICNGSFFKSRFFKCPKGEHFHRECPQCEAKWFEDTFENSHEGAMVALTAAFESAEKIEMSEEDIVREYRLRQARIVHES